MIHDEVAELLQQHYARKLGQAPTRYGTPECPQAWRFIDAAIHPWSAEELAHFATECPFCARTKELQALAESLSNEFSDMPQPAFARFFPGMNWLIEHATNTISASPVLAFLRALSSLEWENPSGLSSFNVAAALGVAQPLHFGVEGQGIQGVHTEAESEEINALAERVSIDKSAIRDFLIALATSLRQPEKAIRELKALTDTTEASIEARLVLAQCYHQLGSQEDAEDQINKSLEAVRDQDSHN